jgi:hypothetical protein
MAGAWIMHNSTLESWKANFGIQHNFSNPPLTKIFDNVTEFSAASLRTQYYSVNFLVLSVKMEKLECG